MILLQDVTKSYGAKKVLSNLSFQVKKGGVTGFLGANGAGKTTTMDILCGCRGFDTGSVEIDGVDILRNPLEARRKLGYLPDVPPLHPQLRVRESLNFAEKVLRKSWSGLENRVDEVLELLGLETVQKQLVGTLSKGFRQRLGLAQAIIHRPELIVLDEPAEGLDPAQLQELRLLIRNLGKESTVFLSSHLLGEVQAVCDELVIINRGQVIAQGGLKELSESLARRRVVHLRIRKDIAKFVNEVSSMKQVVDSTLICLEKGEVRLTVENENSEAIVDQVVQKAVNGSYGLCALEPQESLEEVFLNYTRADVNQAEAGSQPAV